MHSGDGLRYQWPELDMGTWTGRAVPPENSLSLQRTLWLETVEPIEAPPTLLVDNPWGRLRGTDRLAIDMEPQPICLGLRSCLNGSSRICRCWFEGMQGVCSIDLTVMSLANVPNNQNRGDIAKMVRQASRRAAQVLVSFEQKLSRPYSAPWDFPTVLRSMQPSILAIVHGSGNTTGETRNTKAQRLAWRDWQRLGGRGTTVDTR